MELSESKIYVLYIIEEQDFNVVVFASTLNRTNRWYMRWNDESQLWSNGIGIGLSNTFQDQFNAAYQKVVETMLHKAWPAPRTKPNYFINTHT